MHGHNLIGRQPKHAYMAPDDRKYQGTDDGYTANSPFVRLLGTPSRVKILDVLLRRHSSWLGADEIATLAGIDQGTFSRNKALLVELNLVHVDESGSKTTYKTNTDHPVVQYFGKAHTGLLEYAPEVIGGTSPTSQAAIRELISLIDRHAEDVESEDDTDDDSVLDAVKEATEVSGNV